LHIKLAGAFFRRIENPMPVFVANLSVARRLGLGFALVLLLSVITIIVGISRLAAVAEATRYMVADPIKTERLVSDWYRLVHTGVRRTAAIAIPPWSLILQRTRLRLRLPGTG
jgi:hypothetical protein